MRLFPILVATLALAMSLHATDFASVREGDLAFVINKKGNPITSVTQSIDSLPIDHVAILHRIGGDNGPLYALEATERCGVCLTPIDSFVVHSRQRENIIVGRVEDLDVARSMRHALSLVGHPYDFNYMPGDSAVYCSELVQLSYVTHDGKPAFTTIPMTFTTASGDIHPYWVKHYGDQGLPVPEGLPGTNPGQLSRHPQVIIQN